MPEIFAPQVNVPPAVVKFHVCAAVVVTGAVSVKLLPALRVMPLSPSVSIPGPSSVIAADTFTKERPFTESAPPSLNAVPWAPDMSIVAKSSDVGAALQLPVSERSSGSVASAPVYDTSPNAANAAHKNATNIIVSLFMVIRLRHLQNPSFAPSAN